jgi:hypothetical protein
MYERPTPPDELEAECERLLAEGLGEAGALGGRRGAGAPGASGGRTGGASRPAS